MDIRKTTVIRIVVSLLLVGLVAVVGIIVSHKLANYQRNQYFEVRKYQAAAAAACLDYRDIVALKGKLSDENTPQFNKLRNQLIRVKNSDIRVRYVYLMRPKGKDMIFLVDAESKKSKGYSPPGQVYKQGLREEFEVFEGKRKPDPLVYGPLHDPWGVWISASAFVLDNKGKAVALFGTDVDVKRALASFNQIKSIGAIYDALASFLLALVCLQWIVWRYNRDKRHALHEEMEASVLRLNRELVETDRLKSEFIESASHELRGPVSAVDGALQVMEQQLKHELEPAGKELVEIARTGSKRLVELVENLLDVTRIEGGGLSVSPQDVEVSGIVKDVARMFEPLAKEKGLSLKVKVPEGGLVAYVDKDAIRRILENLISNAIKFTDSGEIMVDVSPLDERIRFSVSDTGMGIPENFQQEVFKKFSRAHLSTDSRKRGSGLGLAITKGLVEAHGGRIWIESAEGKGTSVYFEIPRKVDAGGKKNTTR